MKLYLLILAASTLFGAACSSIAGREGKSERLWFSMGYLFGFFALLSLVYITRRNRRMSHNLTVASAASSSGTSAPLSSDLSEHSAAALLSETDSLGKKYPTYPFTPNKMWYYLDTDHQQHGPLSSTGISKAFQKEFLSLDSYVWHEGMKDWSKVRELLNLI